MALWIPVTFAAAAFQTLRFMLQKSLSSVRLSAAGATFSRFVYSAPLILVLVCAYLWFTGQGLVMPAPRFFAYAALGGLAQILATVCVVALFRARNFAVGIAFSKTEVVQTALLGAAVLGDRVSALGWGAIGIGLAAVLVLSHRPGQSEGIWQRLCGRGPVLGVGSGALFAVASVCYRGAALAVPGEDALLRAGLTLAVVVCMQVVMMGGWMLLRERGEILRVWQARRVAVWVGITSMAGSYCWFLAFTLQSAAYVKALGQIEVVLSLLASLLVFGEKVSARELVGMTLMVASVLGLVLSF